MGRTDAYGTHVARRSVCQGYAGLTNVLLGIAGIPNRVVSGHTIWKDYEDGDEVDHSVSDHAWNEAFTCGRWVIVVLHGIVKTSIWVANIERDPNLRGFFS
ncbi:MAG: transglutaminase-like domain-containing protein [Clostridia bacterium]